MDEPSMVVKSRDELAVLFFYLHHLSTYVRELNLQEIKDLPHGFTRKQLKREMKQALRRSINQYYWVHCQLPRKVGELDAGIVYRIDVPAAISSVAAASYVSQSFTGRCPQAIARACIKKLANTGHSNKVLSRYAAYFCVPADQVDTFITSCTNALYFQFMLRE